MVPRETESCLFNQTLVCLTYSSKWRAGNSVCGAFGKSVVAWIINPDNLKECHLPFLVMRERKNVL